MLRLTPNLRLDAADRRTECFAGTEQAHLRWVDAPGDLGMSHYELQLTELDGHETVTTLAPPGRERVLPGDTLVTPSSIARLPAQQPTDPTPKPAPTIDIRHGELVVRQSDAKQTEVIRPS